MAFFIHQPGGRANDTGLAGSVVGRDSPATAQTARNLNACSIVCSPWESPCGGATRRRRTSVARASTWAVAAFSEQVLCQYLNGGHGPPADALQSPGRSLARGLAGSYAGPRQFRAKLTELNSARRPAVPPAQRRGTTAGRARPRNLEQWFAYWTAGSQIRRLPHCCYSEAA